MKEISIRHAVSEDLIQILDIYNDVILNTTAVYSYEPHTLEMREAWFLDRAAQNFPVFVAESGGQVCGFASYGSFRAWPAYQHTIENSVYVHPGHRGRGIAKDLLSELIRHATKAGFHVMIAAIDSLNDGSIRLHQKLGFIEAAHFREVGFKFNKWLDLKFFQLFLDQQ